MRAARTDTAGADPAGTEPLGTDPTATDATGATIAADPPTSGPVVLGRYRLVRRLGAGGFGTVWQARDERLERDVAVKLLPRERIMGGRFEREAKAAARLTHPGIVTLYEAAVDEQGAYLVSELVRGETLAQLLPAGRLSDRDIVAIGIALCDALQHAHGHGVVHRDVKPSNILIPRRAPTPPAQAKLTDFGVARVVGGASLTRTGDVVGTMAYMAPEQAEGRPVGEAADLYSLALVLYEALTGVNPVLNGTVAVRARRLGAYLPPLRRQRRDLPRELGAAIDLALRPRPRERGTIDELRHALLACRELVDDRPGVVEGPWPTALPRPRRELGPLLPTPPGADAAVAEQTAAPPALTNAAGALTAAALTAWFASQPLRPGPIAPAAAALIAGVLILVLPRLGWLVLILAAATTAAAEHHPGMALLLATAGVLPAVLLPADGRKWPLPACAPALGLIGLAGAWPALAARGRGVLSRAGLAASGWLWLLLAGPLVGRALYVRSPTAPPGWRSDVALTAHHVLAPLAVPRLLAPAGVWAIAAALLPLIRPRRSRRAADVAIVSMWAAAGALLTAVSGHGLVLIGEVVLGAIAAAVAALAPDIPRARRPPADAGPELP